MASDGAEDALGSPAFPEELHLPLLFNDEAVVPAEEEARENTNHRALGLRVDGRGTEPEAAAGLEEQRYGIFADPLAFFRSEQ